MFRNYSPDPKDSSEAPRFAIHFIRKISYETECFGIILWIQRTVPKHPIPQFILYKKSVAEWDIPKLFSGSGTVHLLPVIPSHFHKNKTVILQRVYLKYFRILEVHEEGLEVQEEGVILNRFESWSRFKFGYQFGLDF